MRENVQLLVSRVGIWPTRVGIVKRYTVQGRKNVDSFQTVQQKMDLVVISRVRMRIPLTLAGQKVKILVHTTGLVPVYNQTQTKEEFVTIQTAKSVVIVLRTVSNLGNVLMYPRASPAKKIAPNRPTKIVIALLVVLLIPVHRGRGVVKVAGII